MPKFRMFGEGISRLTDRFGTAFQGQDVPAYGASFEGGYFAGLIVDNGTIYALSVAPKATGENPSVAWRSSATPGPAATRTLVQGLVATNAMVAEQISTGIPYPAAVWARGLNINGFTDWYIPARDEMELMFRNLKPLNINNSTTARTPSAINYSADGNLPDTVTAVGTNRNSFPAGAAYTTTVPAQTANALFQSGGSEAFESAIYWTATEFSSSANAVWTQVLTSGSSYGAQSNSLSGVSLRVRAVRRTKLLKAIP